MPDFAPYSWEIPYGSASSSAVTLWTRQPFEGQQLKWELRLIPLRPSPEYRSARAFLWFRLFPSTSDGGFIACEETTPILFPRFVPSDVIRSMFGEILTETKFGRLFFLDSDSDSLGIHSNQRDAILISASGVATWSFGFGNGHSWNGASFDWGEARQGRDFLQLPADSLWGDLQKRLAIRHDKAALVRLFARLGDQARHKFIMKWLHGDEHEMKAILCDILLCQILWDEAPYCDELSLKVRFPLQVEITTKNASGHGLDTPSALLNAVERVWQWFQPFDAEIVDLGCVRDWMKHRLFEFEVSARRPTGHECLEAYMRWQEWLNSIE